jgi:hypothetical protein
METLLSICLGIGLSAACGFRIFVPLLALSIAGLSGHVSLSPGFQWIATYPALITFAVATAIEVCGYYIPWLDHLLDTIASPAAVVAGIMITASLVTNMSPLMKWTLAVIAGGGAAGVIQGGSVLLRGMSTATTGGLGNPIVATVEFLCASLTSIVTIVAPILGAALFLCAVLFLLWKFIRRPRKSAEWELRPSAS